MKVLVTGATGLIGQAVCSALERRSDAVLRLSRPDRWDPDAGTIDRDFIAREAPDAIVHLAGENIGEHRWTVAQKAKIRDSRVRGTELLASTVAALDQKPKVMISASATGIYGDRGEEILTDEAAPGQGFLAEVCAAWEAAAAPAKEAKIRVVHPRLGVVLAKGGGAMTKMLTPFKLGVGGRLGSGRQWMSWVAREDVVGAILYMLDRDAYAGPINVVAPEPVRNSDFTKVIAAALRRPAVIPVPALLLKAMLGEMANEALLASTCVTPDRLLATSFPFRFPKLVPLMTWLLSAAA